MSVEPAEITRQLESIIDADFFYAAADDLIAGWVTREAGVDIVGPILRFVEAHPDLDYGAPGSLVHYIEKFFRSGYEEQLAASLKRKPTTLTVLMLNRWINGASSDQERALLLALLSDARQHPQADEATRKQAADFEDFQTRKHS